MLTAWTALSSCWEGPEEDAPTDGPVPSCPQRSYAPEYDQCDLYTTGCNGDWVTTCILAPDCKWVWFDFRNCAAGTGTCSNGVCGFTEKCPVDVDDFCHLGNVVWCRNGQVDGFAECEPEDFCNEFVSPDGKKRAICAGRDGPCFSKEPSAQECRGYDRVTCSEGAIVAREPCTISPCELVKNADNQFVPTCGSAG